MTATQTPTDRFGLTELARFACGPDEWVVYYDGSLTDVVSSDDYDEETEETDYTEWCQSTDTAPEAVYVIAACHVNDGQGLTSGAHGIVTPFAGRAEAEAMIRDYFTSAVAAIEGEDLDVIDYAIEMVRTDGGAHAGDYCVSVVIAE